MLEQLCKIQLVTYINDRYMVSEIHADLREVDVEVNCSFCNILFCFMDNGCLPSTSQCHKKSFEHMEIIHYTM